MLAGVSMVFCVLQLADLVAALVIIRILLQFLLQQVGVMVLRYATGDGEAVSHMALSPAPAGGDRRISLHIVLAATLCARNFLRHGRRAYRDGDLSAARIQAAGVAICAATNGPMKR